MNTTSATTGQASAFASTPNQSTRGPRGAGFAAGSLMTGVATYTGRWRQHRPRLPVLTRALDG